MMSIPIVKQFLAATQTSGFKAEVTSGFGILHNKAATFSTYQKDVVHTLPLAQVVEYVRATKGTDQGNIWATGLLKIKEHSINTSSSNMKDSVIAQWNLVLESCGIKEVYLPHPIVDPSYF